MAAVGGLLVGAGSGFGVGVIASQSSNNQQFSQPVQTGQNKDLISNKIVKMAMLHKETSKMVAHRMADLKAVFPQGGGQGQGGPPRWRTWSDATGRQWWPTRNGQKMA